MKIFSLWLTITIFVFASIGGIYHLYLTKFPRNILVIVDTSFPMYSVWEKVPQVLDKIGRRHYARFCLITEKQKIYSWSQTLKLPGLLPYAPRNFSKLTEDKSYSEISEATEIYLITNTDEYPKQNPETWKIIRLSDKIKSNN